MSFFSLSFTCPGPPQVPGPTGRETAWTYVGSAAGLAAPAALSVRNARAAGAAAFPTALVLFGSGHFFGEWSLIYRIHGTRIHGIGVRMVAKTKNDGESDMNLDVSIAMANARSTMSEQAFQRAASALSEAKNIVREEMQKETSSRIREIINKLRSSEPISAEEVSLIKIWIVGDAAGYTKMENNLQDWIIEYERLEKSLAKYEIKDCSSEDLLALHGVLEDAIRVGYDIANFLEKRDRINKFESAVAGPLEKKERDFLVRILLGKLQSPDM